MGDRHGIHDESDYYLTLHIKRDREEKREQALP
jgi:hypothetical protein